LVLNDGLVPNTFANINPIEIEIPIISGKNI